MFTLKSLRVRGFRGFLDTDAGNFALDSPITILFGQNGRGKSSTLNAIEWGLFGSECSGTKTEIRERVNWIIPNHHANSGKVTVELEIRDDDGSYLVRRELRSRARRKASDGGVEIELPDGECLTGAQATQFLDRLHRSTFRDFATTVYQHQEAIRAIVTQEPRHRSDAIDRLLGLSDHRNLLNALNKVDAKGRQKDSLSELREFETQVETALQTRENDLEERRNEARAAGVPRNQLNAKAALGLGRDVRRALDQFAMETGLESVPLHVPPEWTGLKSFCETVRTVINKLRGEIPAAKEQEELVERRGKVIGLKSDLETAKGKQAEIGNGIRELDKEYGGQNSVDEQFAKVKKDIEVEKARLRATNARATLIREAIKFLEAEEAKDQLSDLCPVCGNEAPGLLETLHRLWEERLQAQSGEIDTKIKSLEKQAKKLQSAADNYREWNDKLENVMERWGKCCRKAGALLKRDFGAEDEPLPLLNTEANRITERLQELSIAVQEKQIRLSDIEKELEKVKIIHEILHLEGKKEIIEQIQRSPEYTELEAFRDDAAELVDDLEAIRAGISEVMNEEARDKVTAAKTAIDCYFRRLTKHPAVRAIKLEVDANARTLRNDYTITDQDGNDLTPILSQGDLNALALAIFLGLAASTNDSGTFGFVLMDDPSQSLDSEHKKQLVQVLNEVAGRKQLVISTMDRELRDCLVAELTKTKTEYVFEAWTPDEGPTITRM
jgi:DNA repair exonuclease SbcCD ATPase subunit